MHFIALGSFHVDVDSTTIALGRVGISRGTHATPIVIQYLHTLAMDWILDYYGLDHE
jgi:hypothetical protein